MVLNIMKLHRLYEIQQIQNSKFIIPSYSGDPSKDCMYGVIAFMEEGLWFRIFTATVGVTKAVFEPYKPTTSLVPLKEKQ